eukprot:gb/GECG01004296.1/.p1 GENE.gb/GECG01004296.1/~~gb/GECG01004296.1/.p1  ORF type:complete len:592 (+),score=46.04 gb/GECG01004296.1/:1-1776(+)
MPLFDRPTTGDPTDTQRDKRGLPALVGQPPSGEHELRDDNVVSFEFLPLAIKILREVKSKYGSHEEFLVHTYGPPISKPEADKILRNYLRESKINGQLHVKWNPQLNVAGRVYVSRKASTPETPKFTLQVYDPHHASSTEQMLNDRLGSEDSMNYADTSGSSFAPLRNSDSRDSGSSNTVLRTHGIYCFAAHEIGTHLVRSLNEGFQPWAQNRNKFNLCKYHSRQAIETEEGLASLNTAVPARVKYLFSPALLYYAVCRASQRSFGQLMDDLSEFMPNYEARLRLAKRVKPNNKVQSKGQAYFEGAVRVLHTIFDDHFGQSNEFVCQHTCERWDQTESIWNLHMLFAGRLSIEELSCRRVQRVARSETLALPDFARNMLQYREALLEIGKVNYILSDSGTKGRVSTSQGPTRSLSTRLQRMHGSYRDGKGSTRRTKEAAESRKHEREQTTVPEERVPKSRKSQYRDIATRMANRTYTTRVSEQSFARGTLHTPNTISFMGLDKGMVPADNTATTNREAGLPPILVDSSKRGYSRSLRNTRSFGSAFANTAFSADTDNLDSIQDILMTTGRNPIYGSRARQRNLPELRRRDT